MKTEGKKCTTGFSSTGNRGSSVPLDPNHPWCTHTTRCLTGAHRSAYLIPAQPRLCLRPAYPNNLSVPSLQCQMPCSSEACWCLNRTELFLPSLVLPASSASWCLAFAAFVRTQWHLCLLPTCWLTFRAESLPLCS